MASVLVTGSSAGIGRETVATLAHNGHRVIAHARDKAKAAQLGEALPGVAAVLVGDLESLAETKSLAAAANEHGPFDAVVHNAGLGGHARREATVDGLERIFQVNVLAPYVLTALLGPCRRIVYLSSGMQAGGIVSLRDLQFERRRWDGEQAYCDSKLCDVLLALVVARRWPQSLSNAVDPGWVKTNMGGRSAPGSVAQGAEGPIWLATSSDPGALVSGRFLYRRQEVKAKPEAYDHGLQDGLVEALRSLSGVTLPEVGR